MARPPAEATKARILGAAVKLFAEQGQGRTSVREIAKAAEVNVALISHHFGGKEGLYDACVEAMYTQLAELYGGLITSLAKAPPSEDLALALTDALKSGFRLLASHRDPVRLVQRHIIDTGELPKERYREVVLPFIEAAAQLLSARTGRDVIELRFAIQSVFFLLSRYAIASTKELSMLAGCEGASRDKVLAKVEVQLGELLLRMLGVNRPQSKP